MRCPSCETVNRDDREKCYHCAQDLRMLRLIVNKAKHHYNLATSHVEREAYDEALRELDHALELDARFEDAKVLRGTVLVRLGRVAEARAEWEAALALDPALSRAHRYLHELPAVARWVPALRRIEIILAAGAAVVVVSVGLAVAAWMPSPVDRRIAAAWDSLGQPDLAAASEQVFALPPSLTPEDASRREAITRAIAAIEGNALAEASVMIAEGRHESAAAALARLEKLNPTAATRDRIATARRQMIASVEERVGELLRGDLDETAFRVAEEQVERLVSLGGSAEDAGRLRADLALALRRSVEHQVREMIRGDVNADSIAAAERHLARFAEIALSREDAERLRGDMHLAARGTLDREMAKADALLAEGAEPVRVRVIVEEAAPLARIVGEEDRLALRREALARAEAKPLLQRAEAAVASGDIAAYESAMGAFAAIPALPADARREGDLLRERFEEGQRRQILAAFEGASASGDFATALELARRARASGVVLPAEAEESLREAERRVSLDAWYAILADAPRIESGDFDEADAEGILERARVAGIALPERLQPRLTNDVEFYRALALRRLGREGEAREAIAKIAGHHPNSPHLAAWRALAGDPQ